MYQSVKKTKEHSYNAFKDAQMKLHSKLVTKRLLQPLLKKGILGKGLISQRK